MKNRKKQKLSLKKITITRLQPDVISKLKGGGKGEEIKGSIPTEIIPDTAETAYTSECLTVVIDPAPGQID